MKSRLCSLKQVPLSSVKGTGPDGRILKADIEDYLCMLSSVYFLFLPVQTKSTPDCVLIILF